MEGLFLLMLTGDRRVACLIRKRVKRMDKTQADHLFIDQLKQHLAEALDENECLKKEIKLLEVYLMARLKREGG